MIKIRKEEEERRVNKNIEDFINIFQLQAKLEKQMKKDQYKKEKEEREKREEEAKLAKIREKEVKFDNLKFI